MVPAAPVSLLPGYSNQQELLPITEGNADFALSGSLLVTRDNANQVIDFNKDGRPDVFTAGRSVFYLNTGSSTFTSPQNDAYVLYGQADGTYGPDNPTSTHPHARLHSASRFGVLDVNNDGWQDAVVMQVGSDGSTPPNVGAAVTFLLNDQHGNLAVSKQHVVTSFISAQPLPLGLVEYRFLLGDLVTADFGSQSAHPAPLLGTLVPVVRAGTGVKPVTTGFALVETEPTGSQPAGLLASFTLRTEIADTNSVTPEVGDLNGDGYLDVAVPDSDGVTLYFGDGTGAFPTSTILATTHGQAAYTVKLADLNQDGRLDVVSTPQFLSTIFTSTQADAAYATVWMNQGGGGTPTFAAVVSGLPDTPSLFTLADMNLDGQLDLVTSHRETFGTLIATGDGTGRFTFDRTFNALFVPTNTDWPARTFGGLGVQDVNRDGQPDVITQAYSPLDDVSPEKNALFIGRALNATFTAPSVGTGNLPAAVRGQAYSQQLSFAGGNAALPYQATVSRATPLPAGLIMSSTGLVSGVPTQSGPFTLSIIVAQSNGLTGTTPVLLQVNATTLAVSPAALGGGNVSQFYSRQLSASGTAPVQFVVGSGHLPAGLTLSGAGLLSGTPTAAEVSTFTVVATDAAGNVGSRQYAVTVSNRGSWVNVEIAPPGTIDPGYTGDRKGDFVREVYVQLLGRAASPSEVAAWAGLGDGQIVEAVYSSWEHRMRQVKHFYTRLLGREGSDREAEGWARELLAGVSETEVSVAFLLSAEFQSTHSSNGAFVEGLYNVVLQRTGDAASTTNYLAFLGNGGGRRDVVLSFLRSAELGTAVVDDYYEQYLGRAADADSANKLAAFVAGSPPDAGLARVFLTSAEFVAKSRP